MTTSRLYDDFIEAFTIFNKYELKYQEIAAEHDEIFAGPSPEIVSAEDLKRLKELGWTPDAYDGGFSSFT